MRPQELGRSYKLVLGSARNRAARGPPLRTERRALLERSRSTARTSPAEDRTDLRNPSRRRTARGAGGLGSRYRADRGRQGSRTRSVAAGARHALRVYLPVTAPGGWERFAPLAIVQRFAGVAVMIAWRGSTTRESARTAWSRPPPARPLVAVRGVRSSEDPRRVYGIQLSRSAGWAGRQQQSRSWWAAESGCERDAVGHAGASSRSALHRHAWF